MIPIFYNISMITTVSRIVIFVSSQYLILLPSEIRADPDKFANSILGLSDDLWIFEDFWYCVHTDQFTLLYLKGIYKLQLNLSWSITLGGRWRVSLMGEISFQVTSSAPPIDLMDARKVPYVWLVPYEMLDCAQYTSSFTSYVGICPNSIPFICHVNICPVSISRHCVLSEILSWWLHWCSTFLKAYSSVLCLYSQQQHRTALWALNSQKRHWLHVMIPTWPGMTRFVDVRCSLIHEMSSDRVIQQASSNQHEFFASFPSNGQPNRWEINVDLGYSGSI